MSAYKPTLHEHMDDLFKRMKDPERILHPRPIVKKNFCIDCVHNCKFKKRKRVGYGPGCQEFKKKEDGKEQATT